MSLFKLQRGALSAVIGIVKGHCIIGTHANRIGLGHLTNDFCRNCGDEEEAKTVPLLLGICPALCLRRKKYMGAYYMDVLEELSRIDINSLNRFLRSPEWF